MSRPTWEDTVRVKKDAPSEMRTGSLAAVCGIRVVETTEQARRFDSMIGSTLYLIELGDGSAIEVPEALVEVVNETGTVLEP